MPDAATFSWSKYLELATILADDSGEACHRSAISRAYYSAYCSARDWLIENMNFELPPDMSSHKAVWREFAARSRSGWGHKWRTISQKGFRLLTRRHQADYDIPFADAGDGNPEELCGDLLHDTLRQAQMILDDLGKLNVPRSYFADR